MESRNSERTWQEIAKEASREHDPERLLELTQELERALERNKQLRQSEKPAANRKSA